jgi:hypothetical protein
MWSYSGSGCRIRNENGRSWVLFPLEPEIFSSYFYVINNRLLTRLRRIFSIVRIRPTVRSFHTTSNFITSIFQIDMVVCERRTLGITFSPIPTTWRKRLDKIAANGVDIARIVFKRTAVQVSLNRKNVSPHYNTDPLVGCDYVANT